MDGLHIRRAELADAAAILAIQVRGWQRGYAGIIDQEFLDAMDGSDPVRLEKWQSVISEHAEVALVATVNGRTVGWATCGSARSEGPHRVDGVGEVYGFYVDPDAWGSGVADALMEVALRELDDRSLDQKIVWVLRDNPRARRFYARHGFEPDGAQNTHDVDGTPYPTVRLTSDDAPLL